MTFTFKEMRSCDNNVIVRYYSILKIVNMFSDRNFVPGATNDARNKQSELIVSLYPTFYFS